MKKNMSSADRILRVVASAVIALLIYQNVITGTAAVILGILAGVLVATSIFGFCPLYALLKFSTNKN